MTTKTQHMTKTEAAEMLAVYITVEARRAGITRITKDYIEEMRGEARHAGIPGSLIRQAGETCPHWRTIRTAGRRGSESLLHWRATDTNRKA